MMDNFTYYRRHLPHLSAPGATYFVTFRLAGSLPQEAVERMREEWEEYKEKETLGMSMTPEERRKRWYFKHYESLLEGTTTGPHWLRLSQIAQLVAEALHYRDGVDFDLLCYTIMPNHVHAVFTVRRNVIPSNEEEEFKPLYRIMQSLKRHTARQANLVLNRTGPFWQEESYDHIVRDEEELGRIIKYVLDNPVKAGLVREWTEWKWNWVKKDLENWIRLNF